MVKTTLSLYITWNLKHVDLLQSKNRTANCKCIENLDANSKCAWKSLFATVGPTTHFIYTQNIFWQRKNWIIQFVWKTRNIILVGIFKFWRRNELLSIIIQTFHALCFSKTLNERVIVLNEYFGQSKKSWANEFLVIA